MVNLRQHQFSWGRHVPLSWREIGKSKFRYDLECWTSISWDIPTSKNTYYIPITSLISMVISIWVKYIIFSWIFRTFGDDFPKINHDSRLRENSEVVIIYPELCIGKSLNLIGDFPYIYGKNSPTNTYYIPTTSLISMVILWTGT